MHDQAIEAMAWAMEKCPPSDNLPPEHPDFKIWGIWKNEAEAALTALCTLHPGVGAILSGEVTSEAEAERDELFNRLGRVTSELGLSMDCTASRIIEAIYEKIDDEREACASLVVRVEVPPDVETWTPLEAWEEALLALNEARRDAIRNRAASPYAQETNDAE